MIQRIQSIFLLAVVACLLTATFSPIWQKSNKKQDVELTFWEMTYKKNDKVKQNDSVVYLAILAFVGIGLAGLAIFQYKNRRQQILLGSINNLVLIAILALMVYWSQSVEKLIPEPRTSPYKFYQLGFFLPMVAVIFNILANVFIRRDDKLVRSADRMR